MRSSRTRAPRWRRRRWSLEGDRRIEIARDSAGVPHVRAETEPDLARGLGHCHATDRGLQLVMSRIVGSGRAAELLRGSDQMVGLDRFFRRANFGRDADAEVAKLSDRHRSMLEAYVDGVNRALAKRPWELRLLRYRPEPWTVADCVLVARMAGYIGLAQTQGEVEQLVVEMVRAGVPRAHLDELFGGGLHDLDEELVRSLELGSTVVPRSVPWNPAVPAAAASNNWAVAPSRTASGNALFSNDPHLEVNRLPAVWYESVLQLGDRWCAGVSMPGMPFPVIGRTSDVAWGATYSYTDAIDSWVEECRDGAALRRVDGEETWKPFGVRRETIERRDGEPVEVTFYENDHGTLDGDPHVPGRYLATRWAGGHGTGARSIESIFDMWHATTTAEAGELLARLEWSFNWVIADRHGSIGYRMSGRVPKRTAAHSGLVPMPGWDRDADWQGFVEPDDMPQLLDPPEGFVTTANNDLNHLGRAKPINVSGPPYRAARIAGQLGGRDGWTPADAARLQMDVHSPHAQRYMEVLRPLLADDERFASVLAWDCSYGDDSHEAAWFEAFYLALIVDVIGSVCGERAIGHVLDSTTLPVHYFHLFDRVLLDPESSWFAERSRDDAFRVAAEAALPALDEPWGARNRMVMTHPLLDKAPSWLGFDHGPITVHGGRATVHQGQVTQAGGRRIVVAPSFRIVADLGTDEAHTALPGGPSDRRFSPWYRSGVADWHAGRLKRVGPNAP